MKEAKEVKIRLSKRKIMITVLLLIVIILIMITSKIIGLITKERNISNLGNMGLAYYYDGHVYYNKWEEGIFKVNKFSEEKLTDETAYSINIVDDVIYYISVSKDQEILLKSIDINGENMKTLKRLYTSISKIYINNGYIYYVTNEGLDGISRYNIKTGENNLITTATVRDFCVTDDKIYFSDNIENLYSMTHTGLELERIVNKPIIEKFQVQGKYIYFYNIVDNNFCKVDLNGENLEMITNRIEGNANYNVTDKNIYYFDKETNSISVMDLKGENIELIKKINAKKTKINIVDDEIYYLDSSTDPKQAYQMFRVGKDGSKSKEVKYN